MRALDVFEQLKNEHAAHLAQALAPLDEAMGSLDFEAALAHCRLLTMTAAE